MELPVAPPVSEIDLDACLRVPDQDQVQFTVAIDIGQLGRDIPVLAPPNRFRESSSPIADEGLDATEVAGPNDVGEAVMVYLLAMRTVRMLTGGPTSSPCMVENAGTSLSGNAIAGVIVQPQFIRGRRDATYLDAGVQKAPAAGS